jgi:hypothetical protein
MGNASSSYSVEDESAPAGAATQSPRAVRTYIYDADAAKWLVHRSLVDFSFSDAADEAEGAGDEAAAAWHLEAGDIVARVSDSLRLTLDAASTRATFLHDGKVWALKFFSKPVRVRWLDCSLHISHSHSAALPHTRPPCAWCVARSHSTPS